MRLQSHGDDVRIAEPPSDVGHLLGELKSSGHVTSLLRELRLAISQESHFDAFGLGTQAGAA